MVHRVLWRSALLLAALGLASCPAVGPGPSPPPGPEEPPEVRPEAPTDPVERLAADLARQMHRLPVTAIGVCELLGPGLGGKERTSFGVYVPKPVAASLQRRGFRIVHLLNAVPFSPEWIQSVSLSKVDVVLCGTYVLDRGAFQLHVEVQSLNREVFASATAALPATNEYRRLESEKLPAAVPFAGKEPDPKLVLLALKSELYHKTSTEPDARIAVRPVRSPVHLGEAIEFAITSNVAGQLAILYQGSSGALDFLLPNPFVKAFEVKAGETVTIPTPDMAEYFKLQACPPAGVERVKVIVSSKPIPWPIDLDGNVPTGTLAHLRAIRELLGEARFGEGRCEVQTVP